MNGDQTLAPSRPLPPVSRREMLRHLGGGFGALGLAGVLAGESPAVAAPSVSPLSPKAGHHAPRAKRVIFLFMNGGPSHVDTFDPKPALARYDGTDPPKGVAAGRKGKLMRSPFAFRKSGRSGIEVSEIYPEVARCVDDLCIIRSMYHETPAHERALLLMNSGNVQPIRPSWGVVADLRTGDREPEPPRLHRPLPGQARRRAPALEQQLSPGGLSGHSYQ
jgi:hypothetical protein